MLLRSVVCCFLEEERKKPEKVGRAKLSINYPVFGGWNLIDWNLDNPDKNQQETEQHRNNKEGRAETEKKAPTPPPNNQSATCGEPFFSSLCGWSFACLLASIFPSWHPTDFNVQSPPLFFPRICICLFLIMQQPGLGPADAWDCGDFEGCFWSVNWSGRTRFEGLSLPFHW